MYEVLYQFLSVVHTLQVLLLPLPTLILPLQIRLNGLILSVKIIHVLIYERERDPVQIIQIFKDFFKIPMSVTFISEKRQEFCLTCIF